MELLKITEDHEQFIFMNKPINTIEVLIQALKESTDDQFSHHTDDERNDFANWVEHVFNNKEVADKLREEKTREGTISLLQGEIEKRKTASEPVLQTSESVMNSEPKEKPETAEETPVVEEVKPLEMSTEEKSAGETIEESSSSKTDVDVKEEEVKPVEAPTAEETPVVEEVKPLDMNKEIPEETTMNPIQKEEEVKPLESSEYVNPEEEKKDGPESVVTPMNAEDPKDINLHPHHFCPWKFDCTKKEFMYGLFIGLLIGLIGMKIISFVISG